MSADLQVATVPYPPSPPLSVEAEDLKDESGLEKVTEDESGILDPAFLFAASLWKRESFKYMTLCLFVGVVAVGIVVGVRQSNKTIPGLVTVQPSVNSVAMKNPMKGWRGQITRYAWGTTPINDQGIPFSQPIWYTQPENNLESIRKWYATWEELESGIGWEHNNETLALARIREVTDRYLSAMPSRNMKALPRLEVFTKEGYKGPSDLPPVEEVEIDGETLNGDRQHPWWENVVVKKRVERIIRRLGIVWDTDPRVAAVQVCILARN